MHPRVCATAQAVTGMTERRFPFKLSRSRNDESGPGGKCYYLGIGKQETGYRTSISGHARRPSQPLTCPSRLSTLASGDLSRLKIGAPLATAAPIPSHIDSGLVSLLLSRHESQSTSTSRLAYG